MWNQISFQASLNSLDFVLKWVRSYTHIAGLSLQESRKIEIALEEAIVNVIHYAYHDAGGGVELACLVEPSRVEFILKDEGPPFNPIEQVVERELTLENKKEGGLGILLMRHYMDKIIYKREKSYNVLTLIKKIDEPLISKEV